MPAHRVAITGMGWVTPLGTDVESVWGDLVAGKNAVGPVTRFDASRFPTNFAAEVKGFDLADHLEGAGRFAPCGESTRYALAAASHAWRRAGLDRAVAEGRADPTEMGVYLGAGEGTLDYDNFFATNLAGWNAAERKVDGRAWVGHGLAHLTRVREVEQEPNVTVGYVAGAFGCRGPSFNCMTACAASTQAIGEAFEIIRRGDAPLMFAGGSHTMIHVLGMTGFIRLTAMSQRRGSPQNAARPFDQTRDGFVMGEGAGVLVLERLDHALARGAEVLAEIAGYGASADAFRITDIEPNGRGAQAAMTQALRQAGLSPREPGPDGRPVVHYISAHGTGTKENDKIETLAVKGVFGPLAPKVPFSSVKSMMGHLIQAAGAVELITCVQAIRTGWAPPTINLATPDPECDLDYVPNQARDLNPHGGVEVCLSNSFGFGGQNNTLVVRKFRG
ncbi:MAG: beta-ketoacyl-[acyl-carrier-protein] synthase family protein [Phycisphaeraceae bacterium]|nr:MAG: beta-ketoacyl-[acyl-carrier-protein] synthase family protein [Phycisphaeraceae bacterium]